MIRRASHVPRSGRRLSSRCNPRSCATVPCASATSQGARCARLEHVATSPTSADGCASVALRDDRQRRVRVETLTVGCDVVPGCSGFSNRRSGASGRQRDAYGRSPTSQRPGAADRISERSTDDRRARPVTTTCSPIRSRAAAGSGTPPPGRHRARRPPSMSRTRRRPTTQPSLQALRR